MTRPIPPTASPATRSAAGHAQEPGQETNAPWSPPSWEQVVRDHGPRVYRLAYRLTGNPHDAEDLAQETFVRVFRSLSRYEPGTFEGWLHRITTNLFLDGARRRARIRFDPLPEDGDRLPTPGADPERAVLDMGFEADVEAALMALPPDFRAAVVLADIEQLPYEQIADALGVKVGTVRSRIHRGRSQLRQALASREPRSATRRAARRPATGLA
jgi:RNA polymerase sigma-70 factor (ECF subfamily)